MSQSNKTAKNTLYMIFVFVFICIGVILGLYYSSIKFPKNENLENDDNNSKIDVVQENKITNSITNNTTSAEATVKKSSTEKLKLTDKYKSNALEIKDTTIDVGNVIYESEFYTEHKLEIVYSQISGLKNATIQNRINKEIEKTALSLKIEDEINNENIYSIKVYATVIGSFSDVLSVQVMKQICWLTDDSENPYRYETEESGLNYILSSGEKIEFVNLFTEDASIKNILTQSVYDEFVKKYLSEAEDLDINMDEVDYSKIERNTFRVLDTYNKNPNLDFYFSESYIFCIIDNNVYTIEMSKSFESIAIYNKYLSSKNLFLNPDLAKENYVFASTNFVKNYVEAGKKTNNLYFELINSYYGEEEIAEQAEVEAVMREDIANLLGEYIDIANDNKDRGYLVSVSYNFAEKPVNQNSNKSTSGYILDIIISSCDKKYLDTNLENLRAISARQKLVEISGPNPYYILDEENCIFEISAWKSVPDYKKPDKFEYISETKEERALLEQEYYSDEEV